MLNRRSKKIWGILGILSIFSLFAIVFIGFIISENEKKKIELAEKEYLERCAESFADMSESPILMNYACSDFKYSILDCELMDSAVESKYYLVSLQIECSTESELDNRQKENLAYEFYFNIPKSFRSSTGRIVGTEMMDMESPYYREQMVYISVNGELVRTPQERTTDEIDNGGHTGVACPNCGTRFRSGTTGARMIQEYRYCQICNGR